MLRDLAPGSSTTSSPRPLSKVRTSFVTVEKNGQVGLKMDSSSRDSTAERRRSSFGEQHLSQAPPEIKEPLQAELQERKASLAIEEAIPEVAVETPSEEARKKLGGNSRPGSYNDAAPKPTEPTNLRVSQDAQQLQAKSEGTNGSAHKDVASVGGKNATTGKASEKMAANKPASRSAASTASRAPTAAKVAPKSVHSPTTAKTLVTPQKSSTAVRSSSRPPEKKASQAPSTAPTVQKTSQASTGASASKTKIQSPPAASGFVKPRPKSPTKPVKLPASLTAHTASSGSKTASAPPATKQSTSAPRTTSSTQSTARPLSRSSLGATTKGTEARSSTVKKPASRPSLGPPPSSLKKQSSRQSLHSTAAPDEGFLARMMRPTTASASKTNEKHPSTPPKRDQSSRRSIRGDTKPAGTVPKMPKLAAASNHGSNAPKGTPVTDGPAGKVETRDPETVEPPALTVTEPKDPNAKEPEDVHETAEVPGDLPDVHEEPPKDVLEEDVETSTAPVPGTADAKEEQAEGEIRHETTEEPTAMDQPETTSHDAEDVATASAEEPIISSETLEPAAETIETENKPAVAEAEEVPTEAAEPVVSEDVGVTEEANEPNDSNDVAPPELEAINELDDSNVEVEEQEPLKEEATEEVAASIEEPKEGTQPSDVD